MDVTDFPRWLMMFAVVCGLAMIFRIGSSGKLGVALLVLMGLGVGLLSIAKVRMSHIHTLQAAPVRVAMEQTLPPLPGPPSPASPPKKPKRPTKAKPAPRVEKPPVSAVAEFPPMPPMAVAIEQPAPATPAELSPPEAPLTVYLGSSATGKAVDSLPEWTTQTVSAGDGDTGSFTMNSDRFATIDEAEKQLWTKARDLAARDLRQRIPDAAGWSPEPALLRSNGFILERCVERTTIQVGEFVEPMYRVHWRAALSSNVRRAVVDAWRPTRQEKSVGIVAIGLMSATGLFAFMNLVLRGVSSRLASRRKPAAT